jgi:DNA-binding transcriptional LysR family regulator
MDLLTQMATFVRVVDGNSLSAAARAQRLSLAAVSRQLTALEAELGASLLIRSTRRLRVTDAGRDWYRHSVRVLREVEEARAAVRPSTTARGTIVVSASLTYGSVILVHRLGGLAEKHPHLLVDLRLEDQLVDIVGEGVDVAIRVGSPPPDSTSFIAHPIHSMKRVLVAAPRFLRKHGVPRTPRELAQRECLLQVTPRGVTIRFKLERAEEEETVDVRGHIRSNAPIALRDLAIGGAGIAYLPDWLVNEAIADGRLRRVLPAWASPPIVAWAVHRAELREAPRLRALLSVIATERKRGT